MEILREHFEECFKHFLNLLRNRYPKANKERGLVLEYWANFLFVSQDTVSAWINSNGNRCPSGQTLVKTMCFLDTHGYRIIELERMDKTVRGFSELIGFGISTAEEASRIVGFEKIQSLYDVFWEKVKPSEPKKLQMWESWKQHKEEVERRKKETFDSSPFRTIADTPKQTRLNLSTDLASKRHGALLQIIGGLLSLLEEEILSDRNPDKVKQENLQKIGKLSEQLNTLSSAFTQEKQ